ncbi:MAG: lipopolysaccharide assembly protein LapB [Gammaproteobacteria bacterium]|nr:lipopolysaccharide assembly protein LapB [Gammaproteobacteria bacterium]
MPADSTLLLAGLFILAAASGWAFARYTERDEEPGESRRLSADYFAGLNHLLKEQPDEALEAFMRMVDVDSESVETHFALGSLFRRRGEVDRAIRLHQNLIARPDLSREHRDQALFALGEDYQRAGLFDRAESLFQQVAETHTHGAAALENLVRIFELQKDWEQAIDARRKLERLRPRQDESRMIAHYHCELAEKAIAAGDLSGARKHLKKAQSGRERTTRGALMRGDVAASMGDHELAVDLYRRVLDEDKALLPELLPRLRRSLAASGKAGEFASILGAWVESNPELRPAVAYAAILNDLLDDPSAAACVREYIESQTTLREIYGSFEFIEEGDLRGDAAMARICGALRHLAQGTPRYSCRQCGFQSATLFWQCPGCKAWDTIRPNSRFHFAALIDPAAY